MGHSNFKDPTIGIYIYLFTSKFIKLTNSLFRKFENMFHICFKRHKMGIKLNILSILLHPSQFVYNYILNIFFHNFLIFLIIYREINFIFFRPYRRTAQTLPTLFCSSFCPSQLGRKITKISTRRR